MPLSGIPIGIRPPCHPPDLMGTNEEPWMTRGSIDFLYEALKDRESLSILEFGSGSSTGWFLKMFPKSKVTSVEHSRAWVDEVSEKLPPDLRNRWRPVLKPSTKTGECRGSDYEFYDEYVVAIDPSERFDVIVIDGRARSRCILNTIGCLSPNGFYVVDNAERARYRKAMAKIPFPTKHSFPTSVDTTIVWHNK